MATEDLIHFKPGYDPRRNLKGRAKKYQTSLTEKGYKKSEITDAINILISMDKAALEEVAEDEEATVLERVVALAILESIRKKTLYNIETLLTRVYGQPKQEIEQQVNITAFKVKFNGGDNISETGL
jgi:hypothetical protein